MRFDAMRIVQPSGREVFSFAAEVHDILRVCAIPRIRRGRELVLEGYQRPELPAHVSEIRAYLDTPKAVLPNAIVVVFDHRANFVPATEDTLPCLGELHVPDAKPEECPPGFVVDGQQRLAALVSSSHTQFPIFVTALLGCDIPEQRKQFVLVNRTRPLPPGLVFELLPEIEGDLPPSLEKQRVAAQLTVRLNLDRGSALRRLIRTPTCPEGFIKDNSVRRMLMNSLTDGALYDVRSRANGNDAVRTMAHFVSIYWHAVARVFPEAASAPPKSSRLSHGVGFVSMGYVMDYLHGRLHGSAWSIEKVALALEPLVPHCAWTDGYWRFRDGERLAWNELQNLDRDIRRLSTHLIDCLARHS